MVNSKKTLLYAVILLIAAVGCLVWALIPPPALVNTTDVPYTDMTDKNGYQIDELYVYWEYASSSGGDNEGSYYLAYFADKDNELCTASLYFDHNDTWKEAALAHDFSEEDLLMNGCFSAQSISSIDKDLGRYYDEAVEEFIASNEGYLSAEEIKDTRLHLKFVCDDEADYASQSKGHFYIIAAVLAVAGIIFLVLTKVLKKKEAEQAQRQAAAYNPYGAANPYGAPNPYGQPTQPTEPTQPTTEDRNNYQGPEF